MLKNMSIRAYTSTTNMTNIIAYIMRAFVEKRAWLFVGTVPIMLPGVNGVSANALKGLATAIATAEGFGKGEFSAYCNNIRAIVSAVAPIILAKFYVWSNKKGFGASTYWLVGLIAGVLPELLFRNMTDNELKLSSS